MIFYIATQRVTTQERLEIVLNDQKNL